VRCDIAGVTAGPDGTQTIPVRSTPRFVLYTVTAVDNVTMLTSTLTHLQVGVLALRPPHRDAFRCDGSNCPSSRNQLGIPPDA